MQTRTQRNVSYAAIADDAKEDDAASVAGIAVAINNVYTAIDDLKTDLTREFTRALNVHKTALQIVINDQSKITNKAIQSIKDDLKQEIDTLKREIISIKAHAAKVRTPFHKSLNRLPTV